MNEIEIKINKWVQKKIEKPIEKVDKINTSSISSVKQKLK
jgi:hypothetical protein